MNKVLFGKMEEGTVSFDTCRQTLQKKIFANAWQDTGTLHTVAMGTPKIYVHFSFLSVFISQHKHM